MPLKQNLNKLPLVWPRFFSPTHLRTNFWRAGWSENGPRTNTSESDHRKYRYTMIKSDKNDQIRSKCNHKNDKINYNVS